MARSGTAESALVVPCDVADAAAVDAAFAATVGRFGRLDMLFNNAGTNVGTKTIDELTVDEWNTVISVNLHGAFLCARAAFAQMRGQAPQADGSMKPEARMDVNHEAQVVVQMANYPLETNVQFITIMATKMPFIERGEGVARRLFMPLQPATIARAGQCEKRTSERFWLQTKTNDLLLLIAKG